MNTPTYNAGKWRWRFAPGAEECLRDVLENWERLEHLPGAEVLKSNLSRTVIALPSISSRPALIIKRYHVRGVSERLKYLFLPSRAASEWTALQHLKNAEVAVPRPLGFGEERSGRTLFHAGLIMENLLNAQVISKWLRHRRVGDPERIEVLRQVGRQIAKLHSAGCRHRDLHSGNILVHEGAVAERPQVALIDHHACRIGAMPSERTRRNNLAKVFHSLLPKITHSEALELLRAYEEAVAVPRWSPSALQQALDDLVHRVYRLEGIRLRSRSKRCWKNSSQFVRTVSRGWRVYRRREVPLESLRVFQEGRINLEPIFKDQVGQLVGSATLELENGTQAVMVKQHSYRALWRRMWHCFYPGPLHHAWGAARALDVRGIPNPKALALMVQYRHGLPVTTILITERIIGARTLHEELIDHYSPQELKDCGNIDKRISSLAKLTRRLHDAGICHRDLSLKNILVSQNDSGGYSFHVIDLDSIVIRRRLTDKSRRKNLVQLGLLPDRLITTRNCLQFLRVYDGGEGRYRNREWVRTLNRKLTTGTPKNLASQFRDTKWRLRQ